MTFLFGIKYFPVLIIFSGIILITIGVIQIIQQPTTTPDHEKQTVLSDKIDDQNQQEKTGVILDDGGLFIEKTEASNTSNENVDDINNPDDNNNYQNSSWSATDYKHGDITTRTYSVKRGDTLWEIAEAYYGNGSEWGKILIANSNNIGFLQNGSQALIIPGQILILPK